MNDNNIQPGEILQEEQLEQVAGGAVSYAGKCPKCGEKLIDYAASGIMQDARGKALPKIACTLCEYVIW